MAEHVAVSTDFNNEYDRAGIWSRGFGKHKVLVQMPLPAVSTHTETGSSVQNTARTNIHN